MLCAIIVLLVLSYKAWRRIYTPALSRRSQRVSSADAQTQTRYSHKGNLANERTVSRPPRKAYLADEQTQTRHSHKGNPADEQTQIERKQIDKVKPEDDRTML